MASLDVPLSARRLSAQHFSAPHFSAPHFSATARRVLLAAAVAAYLAVASLLGPATAAPQEPVGGPLLTGSRLVVDRPAGVPAPPPLTAKAWLLADLRTGEVLAAKAPHAPHLPASTLKALTAHVLLPRIDVRRSYLAADADVRADGTKVGMVPGQRYRGSDLFNALLMASGNDAAYALARVGGGAEGMRGTVALMNAEARHLGALDTVVADPSGLDAPGQHSSAYDLALIGRAAMTSPEFRAYAARKQAKFPGVAANGRRSSFQITNHNRLLWNYDGTIGIKNGYTVAADHTLISAVRRGDRTLLLAQLKTKNPSWREPAAVYDWAFRYADRLGAVGRLVEPGELDTPPTPTAGDGVAEPGAGGEDSAADPGPAAVERSAEPVVVGPMALVVGRPGLLLWGAAAATALMLIGVRLVISKVRRVGADHRARH